MRRYFFLFFISGFCSVLYELVWLRLAMAQFGVTTALVSIVLSMFMAGLGLGSWLAGALLLRYGKQIRFPVLRLYASVEFLIGISGLLVPHQLAWGRAILERTTLSSSASYYLVAGLWMASTLVPWCACMGATIPLVMAAIRHGVPSESSRSFSFLYLANVFGAVVGAGLPLLLIELFGFHFTLTLAVVCNFLLAASATALTFGGLPDAVRGGAHPEVSAIRVPARPGGSLLVVLLFFTGLTSMGMEVVWIRQFTPYLGTVVYAFAFILAIYLSATLMGSHIYRKSRAASEDEGGMVWIMLAVAALLPVFTTNPDILMTPGLRVLLGVAPFTGLLGFLTPMLVDRWSMGDPARAGSAYAVNVLGCIIGPLVAGFLLLPHLSENSALLVLSLPWLLLGTYPRLSTGVVRRAPEFSAQVASFLVLPLAGLLIFTGKGFEASYPDGIVLRDSTATIIATGTGRSKSLLVNGVGITALSPITKMMAHLPLASLGRPPKNALVVCFGMGTTYRSLMSWGIPVTVVELVPSVPRVFSYFHADAPELLHSPRSHVVIDDGRRYLERTSEQYDVITIDPPPPVEAAGSSLLYSEEFYSIVKRRLRPDGIFQQWMLNADPVVMSSMTKAVQNSFPYVRLYRSFNRWGDHILASNRPLPDFTPAQLVQRMPAKAVEDLMEWGPEATPERQFGLVLAGEISVPSLVALAPQAPPMRDDRPMNEYYLLRQTLVPARWAPLVWRER